MKFAKADFPLIRMSLLAICVSSLVSGFILYSSSEYVESAQKERRSAQNMLDDARNRLIAAHQDKENMGIYASEYGALVENRIIGDDRRLDWMEGLEDIRRQNLAADIRYAIAPQKIHAPQPPIDSGNFDIRYSEMKLQIDLLHEEKLPDLFAALRNRIKGWYQLEGCTLQRTGTGNENEPTAKALIRAECNGGWITLKNRNTLQ